MEELAELQLCRAPHRFFDPNHEVRNTFLSVKLHFPEHQPDPEEERFQDIFNYVEKLREVATPETITQTRFQAINTMENLLQMRITLLESPAVNIKQVEEYRKKEIAERWEREVAIYKKKIEQVSGTKPPTASQKKGTSTVAVTSQ